MACVRRISYVICRSLSAMASEAAATIDTCLGSNVSRALPPFTRSGSILSGKPVGSCAKFSFSNERDTSRRLAAVISRASLAAVFRFARRDLSLGSELVIELLVAVMKELLAAFRKGVGNALRIR